MTDEEEVLRVSVAPESFDVIIEHRLPRYRLDLHLRRFSRHAIVEQEVESTSPAARADWWRQPPFANCISTMTSQSRQSRPTIISTATASRSNRTSRALA
jgi:hypothetical protein